tara:strand:+ start:101 stop:562 length:462 start_codon:yes stop_codon:yes gene_type:complete
MKKCKGCGQTKNFSDFYVAKKNKNGSILYKNFCKSCHREKDLKRYYNLPESDRKKRNKINREKLGEEYFKKDRLQRRYNISLEEYNILNNKQNNKCYICNILFKNTSSIRVDHNHKTKKVRKLLCHNCNTMLGHAKEDSTILYNAIKYIEEHN